ncbi:hypothetical protein IBE10_07375 [Francisella tularensis subsp. novicida]|uniref:hypothetical protein n=1 Tax=Francisella tularensis TaxID=263 RepID=UPI0008FD5BED|nr:hypothetical protein [Francisella tularensis]APC95437.1 hypothetical protein KX02_1004 [Francisella tularensis subsp. novicida]MBK2346740.1 hypothetical protein [Francisella tularensis subsp. novicida]
MKSSNKRIIGLWLLAILLICVLGYFFYGVATKETIDPKVEALKPKIAQELDSKYHEKFKVVKGKFDNQSKTYTFIVETNSIPDRQFTVITDLTGRGSFVSNFLQTRQAIESAKLVESYFKGIVPKGQYKAVASGASISPVELPEDQKYLSDLALDNLHTKAMHLDEWIKTSHQAIRYGTSIKINIKETPENILKVLEATYKLNEFLKSKDFFVYEIVVQLMDLPEKPKFVKFPLTTEIYASQQGWEADKYTWATIDIGYCTINKVKKKCGYEPNIPKYAYIGKNIKNPLDVAKYFKFIPRHSIPWKAWSGGEVEENWSLIPRSNSKDSKWLIDTPIYQQVKDLYTKEEK